MGLMGLLFNFALQSFHVLAWPLLALCYPLCASVHAIENNSKTCTLKLITYWVCFSLISLFEHAFHRLLEWLPHWPYLKLIIVGCLVTPHFDGSFYIYHRVVHPCLSVNPRVVFNRFIKPLEMVLEQDKPEGTEAQPLQNLIAFTAKVEQLKLEQKGISTEKVNEKDESSATNPVKQTEPGFALPGNATFDPLKTSEMNAAIEGTDHPDLMAGDLNPQNEWFCAASQVPTTSEADLISYLLGQRHANEPEKTKQTNENVSTEQTCAETLENKFRQDTWTCILCKVKCTRKADLISHFQGQRHAKSLESLKAKSNVKYFFKPWTCGVCQVMLKNKNDLILHLESKRHSAACELQKLETKGSEKNEVSSEKKSNSPCKEPEHDEAINPKRRSVVEVKDSKWWCTICNVSCSGEGNMNQHLNGSLHLARAMLLRGAAAAAAAIGEH